MFTHGTPKSSLGTRSKVTVRSRSNWNLEMLVLAEGGKPEYPEKNPRSTDENQQQAQPTYDAESGNGIQATLVEGECSDIAPSLPPFFLPFLSLALVVFVLCLSQFPLCEIQLEMAGQLKEIDLKINDMINKHFFKIKFRRIR